MNVSHHRPALTGHLQPTSKRQSGMSGLTLCLYARDSCLAILQALYNLAFKYTSITQELIYVLESLQHSKGATRHRTIPSALRTIQNARKITGIKSQLQTVRDKLQSRIANSIRDDQMQGHNDTNQKVRDREYCGKQQRADRRNPFIDQEYHDTTRFRQLVSIDSS